VGGVLVAANALSFAAASRTHPTLDVAPLAGAASNGALALALGLVVTGICGTSATVTTCDGESGVTAGGPAATGIVGTTGVDGTDAIVDSVTGKRTCNG